MRILLISPAIYDWRGKLIRQKRIWLPGLTLPYLAALMPSDYDIKIIDETSEEIPFNEKWDLVGISSIGASLHRATEISNIFREQGIPVIVGGISATLMGPEYFKDQFTSYVTGETENTWPEIQQDFESNRLKPFYTGTPADLSQVPVPRYDLFNPKKIGYWMPVQSSRGCIYNCPFCSVASVHKGKFRKFPIDYVIKSVLKVKELGYRNITIIDDSIGSDVKHLKELCEELIPLKINWMSQCTINIAEHADALDLMAKSGCTVLSIGIESVNSDSIDSIHKKINKTDKYKEYLKTIRNFGIDISTEMMIGLDGDTENIFEEFYRFTMENHISVPRFYIVTPIPGTPLYDEWKMQNRIFNFEFKNYSGAKLVFYPKYLQAETTEANYWQLYERVFSLNSILSRYIRSRPARGLLSNIFTLGANFHYRRHIKQRIPPGIV